MYRHVGHWYDAAPLGGGATEYAWPPQCLCPHPLLQRRLQFYPLPRPPYCRRLGCSVGARAPIAAAAWRS